MVCQDHVDSVLRGWEDMILPLPKHKKIGEYNIPEVRLEETDGDCHSAEVEEVYDDNDDIDDEVEIVESARLTASSNTPLDNPVANVNSEKLNSKVSPKTPKRGSSATPTRLEIQDDSEEEVLHTTSVQEKKQRHNPGSRLEDSDKDGLWTDSQEPIPKQRKKLSRWTDKEVTALKAGYKKYGHQCNAVYRLGNAARMQI